jgi:FkbM family methyltransferase
MKSFIEEWVIIESLYNSDNFMHHLKQLKDKAVILYGAGNVGISVAKNLLAADVNVKCFCDKVKTGVHKETGLTIISPKNIKDNSHDDIIIVTSHTYFDEIKNDLSLLGICTSRIIPYNDIKIHEMTTTLGEIKPHYDGFKRGFELFSDDKSKQIFIERIKCYLTSAPITASPSEHQYFDPEILLLSEQEIFVDGGMFIGDTADSFFKNTNNKFNHYHGFEPDEENYNKAVEFLKNKSNVSIIPKGLYSNESPISFMNEGRPSKGSASRISEAGNTTINVTSLDVYFTDKEKPTFIKMDIEGAELEAIKGSENIIKNHKPKLAISAYHKLEDLYTLPELINSYRNDYTFYLRHYTDSIYETILYAV